MKAAPVMLGLRISFSFGLLQIQYNAPFSPPPPPPPHPFPKKAVGGGEEEGVEKRERGVFLLI